MRVVVIGLGLDGLITGWVLRQHPLLDVAVVGQRESYPLIETDTPHTTSLGNFFRAIGLPHSSFQPKESLLLRGGLGPTHEMLARVARATAQRVLDDWRRKAGLSRAALNGELSRPKRRLRFDERELGEVLSCGAKIIVGEYAVEPGRVHTERGKLEFDHLAVSDPFWLWARCAWFSRKADYAEVKQLSARVLPRPPSPFRAWDLVTTPYTPADAIYRVRPWGGELHCDSRPATVGELLSDLNWLLPAGYELTELLEQVVAIDRAPSLRWPEHVAPIGRSANPAQHRTLHDVLLEAYEHVRRLTRG